MAGAFSDIMVGADGVLYIADWYDPMVGGHGAADKQHIGKIYRIAPKGFKPKKAESESEEDLLASPAHNVRFQGFEKLRAGGASSLPLIKKLLNCDSPWLVGRAIWVLPYLGEQGIAELNNIPSTIGEKDYRYRAAALRSALRYDRENLGWSMIEKLKNDKSAHVRRIILNSSERFSILEEKECIVGSGLIW